MKLKDYKEYTLALCTDSNNFYIAKDTTNGYFRNIILNLKSDIEISLDITIDYEEEIYISQKTLDKSYIRSASPISICFKYNGQVIYEENGYYAVFETHMFGLFIPSSFSFIDDIERGKYSLYALLNEIILDSLNEYKETLKVENKSVTDDEWSWI